MGAAPQPFANLVLPLTKGSIHVADASGFTGIAFDARGNDRYRLSLESYGINGRNAFGAPFEAGSETKEIRIPFTALRSADPKAALDLTRLRSVVIRLEGEPGGTAWLELGNVRFY